MILFFWLVIAVLFFGTDPVFSQSMVPSPALPATDVPPATSDRLLLDKAKRLFESQQLDEALAALEEFIDQGPPPTQLQEAYFLRAAALHMNSREREAASSLEQLLDEFPNSPLANEARLLLAEIYVTLKEPERATRVLAHVLNFSSEPTVRRDALRQMREVQFAQGDALRAVHAALEEMALVGHADRLELKSVIQELILQHLDEPSLEDLIETYPNQYPGDLATIRLIELHTARGDEVLAERDIRSFVKQFPQHPYAQTAMALLQSFISKTKVFPHVMAAFLPFSGAMKTFGIDSLNGIRMALEDSKIRYGLNSVGLVVKDTASSLSPLRYEFAQTIQEYHPIAIIGPLLSREIQTVANFADEHQIPIVTPSATLLNVRQFGSYWFSTALTSSLQAYQLVQYAMRQLQFKRFCIIHPQTTYGREFSYLFSQAVEEAGGEIIAVENYTEDEADISPQILRLKQIDLAKYGKMETIGSLRAMKLLEEAESVETIEPLVPLEPVEPLESTETEESSIDEDQPVYVPGFDAVFLPGKPVHVASISAQLAFHDINVTLLGPNSWHNLELFRWARNGIEGGIFTDGLFLESPDPSVQDFARRYRTRFGSEPSIFSVQAYDAALVILETIRKGARSGQEIREQLVRRHDLPALSGLAS
ncbi:MAG: penicillin-binding protein activator, partial [Nitrospirota bacterium]